jgi:(hydroxyamino)benzene mutase
MENHRHRLLMAGILLFLAALLLGMIVPLLPNPRMALTAHLVGLLGGLFLLAVGLIWREKKLPERIEKATFWLALYGTYVNFSAAFLGAVFNTNRLTPQAGSGRMADAWKENIVTFGLVSEAGAMIACCVFLLWGLSNKRKQESSQGELR